MSEHDPLCLEADLCGQCDRAVCICKWIAKARADERERVAREIEDVARGFDRYAMAVLVGARVARRQLP